MASFLGKKHPKYFGSLLVWPLNFYLSQKKLILNKLLLINSIRQLADKSQKLSSVSGIKYKKLKC